MTPEEVRLKVMKRTQTLIDSAAYRSAKQQAKAKAYHEKRVRIIPELQIGNHLFVDTPPSLEQTPAEQSADETQGKLRIKTTETNEVLEVKDTTVRVVKEGI